MRTAPPIVVVASLVLALTWFSLRSVNPEAELFDHTLADLDHFAMIENFQRTPVSSRGGGLQCN